MIEYISGKYTTFSIGLVFGIKNMNILFVGILPSMKIHSTRQMFLSPEALLPEIEEKKESTLGENCGQFRGKKNVKYSPKELHS